MAGATGSAPRMGPCSDFTDWDQVESCCAGLVALDSDEQAVLLEVGTLVVYGITGGRYQGQCTRILNPCRPACVRSGCCRCPTRARLDLGPQPIWGAFVTVDAVDVEVTIEDWRWVVRSDGLPWPTCEQVWTVEYTYGWPVPADIAMATARLVCEFAKQCQGKDCALDPRTTSYSREGVTVQIADPNQMIGDGKTGIPFVDLILSNPQHRIGGGLVDLAADPGYVTTWPV